MPATNQRTQIAALLVCLIVSAACATHNPTQVTQTALQATIQYNAAVAKANTVVEKAVEDAVTSKVLTANQARPVIASCLKIAQTSESIRMITSQGSEATWSVDGPKVRAILATTPVQVPPTANSTIDLLIQTLNSAMVILQGVK